MLDETTITGELLLTAQECLRETGEDMRRFMREGVDMLEDRLWWEEQTADLSEPLGRTFYDHVVLMMFVGAARGVDPIEIAECFVGEGVLSDD